MNLLYKKAEIFNIDNSDENTLDYKKIELDTSEIPTIHLYEKFEFREDYKKYIMKKRIEVSYEK